MSRVKDIYHSQEARGRFDFAFCPLRGVATFVHWGGLRSLLCPRGDIPSTGKTDQAPLGGQHTERCQKSGCTLLASLKGLAVPPLQSPKTSPKFFPHSRAQGTLIFLPCFVNLVIFKGHHRSKERHRIYFYCIKSLTNLTRLRGVISKTAPEGSSNQCHLWPFFVPREEVGNW